MSYQGSSCVMRDNSHQILQELGYAERGHRNAIIDGVREALAVCYESFECSSILRIVKQWNKVRFIACILCLHSGSLN